jgi:ribosomal protein S12 methylthiotransferase accessory factor
MNLNKEVKIILNYLQSKNNIIKGIYPIDFYNDYPQFYQYATTYSIFNESEADNKLVANAISENKKEALIKTIMETLERFYLTISPTDKELIKDNFLNLKEKLKEKSNKIKILNPENFFHIIVKNNKFRFNQKTNFHWVKAIDLLTNNKVLIPAQLFYFTFSKEPIIRFPDSSGTASNFSINDALKSSVLELIERDSFAIFFYTKKEQRRVDLLKINNKKLKEIIEKINKYRLLVYSFDIATDLNIPTIASFIVDKSGIGPALTCGVATDFNVTKALKKSILECCQALNSLRDISLIKNEKIKTQLTKKSPITKRLIFWSKKENLFYFKYLFSLKPIPIFSHKVKENIENNKNQLKKIKKMATSKKINIFWKKVSPKILEKYNIFVVKSVSPDLIPLSLFYDFPYLNHPRLRKYKLKEEHLLKLPHPLP